jgi:dynein heavy chain
MVTMIMEGDNELNKTELDFFLKGNTSLEAVEMKKPYPWLTENGWKDIQRLEGLGGGECWNGLIDALRNNGPIWKTWYDLEMPE